MSTLVVKELTKTYLLRDGLRFSRLEAVKAVDFELSPGRTVALVGQSGSGKSTIAKLIAQLETPTSGSITLNGKPVGRRGRSLAAYRDEVQMVFQDPFASLNPRLRVHEILAEPLKIHGVYDRSSSEDFIDELIERVGLHRDQRFRFAHEFSGGQRQRIGIARALALHPKMLILDEPVSALDVSVQAQVLELLTELQRDEGLTYLFITHDLAVVRQLAHRVAVMRAGQIVELAPTGQIFTAPEHEYTRELLGSIAGSTTSTASSTVTEGVTP